MSKLTQFKGANLKFLTWILAQLLDHLLENTPFLRKSTIWKLKPLLGTKNIIFTLFYFSLSSLFFSNAILLDEKGFDYEMKEFKHSKQLLLTLNIPIWVNVAPDWKNGG